MFYIKTHGFVGFIIILYGSKYNEKKNYMNGCFSLTFSFDTTNDILIADEESVG
jgi:hypothetical protein